MALPFSTLFPKPIWLVLTAAFLYGIIGMGYWVDRSNFAQLMTYWLPMIAAYVGVLYGVKDKKTIQFFLIVAILLRLLLVFSFPNLSDDIYRFVWDGRLCAAGINPFNFLPNYFLEAQNSVAGLTPELYAQLNSPEYYTIYPPICQALFWNAAIIAPDSLYGSSLVMKSWFFLFEIGSIWLIIRLLRHFRLPAQNVLIYALNPLIMVEIMGNLHFEGLMVFFLLLALWALVNNRLDGSAVAIALSIASKLLPLLFLPFLLRYLDWKKWLRYYIITGIVLLLLFSPLLNEVFIHNFANSLDLYFQKFEFNASIYYFLRSIGQWMYGYNLIQTFGPALALFVLLGILWRVWRLPILSSAHLPIAFLFAITLYLLSATTIHPWYLSLPIVLCLFTRYRYPILWSILIFFTYINYSYPEFFENLWIVTIEYVLVLAYLFWEWKVRRLSSN